MKIVYNDPGVHGEMLLKKQHIHVKPTGIENKLVGFDIPSDGRRPAVEQAKARLEDIPVEGDVVYGFSQKKTKNYVIAGIAMQREDKVYTTRVQFERVRGNEKTQFRELYKIGIEKVQEKYAGGLQK